MSTSLCRLPIEIRQKILDYCSKKDLINLAACSKSWHRDATPMAWKTVTIDWKRLAEKGIEIKTVNLRHTRELRLQGRIKDRGEYGEFKFGIMVRNCNSDWLTSISFKDSIMPGGLQLISEALPRLRCLKLECIYDVECFDIIPSFQHLETLFIGGCVIEDFQVQKILENLENHRDLEIRSCRCVTESCLVPISKSKQLRKLFIRCFLPIEFCRTLTELHNLVHLNLSYNDCIYDRFFVDAWINFPALESLDICRVRISDVGLASISKVSKLKHLDVSRCQDISNKGLECLQQLLNLETLSCSNCPISDTGLIHVSAMVSLRSLDVSECTGITDEGLKLISRIPNLRCLNIGGIQGLSDAGVSHIRKLKLSRVVLPNHVLP